MRVTRVLTCESHDANNNEIVFAAEKILYVTSGPYRDGFAGSMCPASFGISIQSREHIAVLQA